MAFSSPVPLAATGVTPPRTSTAEPRASVAWLPAATGAVVLLILLAHQFAQPDLSAVYADPFVRLSTLVAVLLGAALATAHRFHLASPSARVALGLVFAVAVAWWISIVETASPAGSSLRGVSAVGPWIVFVCILRPARTAWTLGAGLTAASMWPLAWAINHTRLGLPIGLDGPFFVWSGVNYLMAILACLFGRRMAQQTVRTSPSGGLGSYRLLAPIGSGGMGEVWAATHHMLARRAAVKLVRPRTATLSARQADVWVKRFQREANIIAGLQSPNTIYLYDFGVADDGQFYYAMELLDGISLETLVGSFGAQPAGRVRAILLQVCGSLEEAHQRGMVHRDLKPSNIMLCKLALTYDFVKVLDFGLAKCAACEDVTQLSADGVVMGTPGYMAPEVVLAEGPVDGRADVYGLGCVAYFLLTGSLVFPDTNPMSMAVKHVQEPPVPPSTRTELPIPEALEAVVMQCLAKKPADRPSSARDLADRLAACVVGDWTQADATAWWERHLPDTSSLRVALGSDVTRAATSRPTG